MCHLPVSCFPGNSQVDGDSCEGLFLKWSRLKVWLVYGAVCVCNCF